MTFLNSSCETLMNWFVKSKNIAALVGRRPDCWGLLYLFLTETLAWEIGCSSQQNHQSLGSCLVGTHLDTGMFSKHTKVKTLPELLACSVFLEEMCMQHGHSDSRSNCTSCLGLSCLCCPVILTLKWKNHICLHREERESETILGDFHEVASHRGPIAQQTLCGWD